MGSTGKSGGTAVSATGEQTPVVALPRPFALNANQQNSMLAQFQQLKDFYEQQVEDLRAAPKTVKDIWDEKAKAAQRLLTYGAVPALSAGHAAEIIWEALPSGSVVEISGSGSGTNDGTWIKGDTTLNRSGVEGRGIWTHLTLPDGTKANQGVYRANDDLPGMIQSNGKVQLRIKTFGK